MSAETEIDRLATYIMKTFVNEPGRTTSGSAVDVAIQLLESYRAVADDPS